ncbi:MAG: hypothetical protein D3X82_10930 [Candidatus Leucobacter sulfamidivorax]|nr:hypothetical protein [Candidatus Leucobacter sulfamidivorax]
MRKRTLAALATLALGAGGSLLFASPATAADFDFVDTPDPAPTSIDGSTVSRAIEVSGVASTIADVVITLDFHKVDGSCDAPGQGAAYSDEIGFSLASPAGTVVPLVLTYPDQPSYPDWQARPDRTQVTLSDSAATPLGAYPETGVFLPAQALSAFAGEDANGTWTLNVTDSVGADPLCYYGATLTISDEATPPGPNPPAPNPPAPTPPARSPPHSPAQSATKRNRIRLCVNAHSPL